MKYCYECGNEISEADGFCPYCGISLKPLIAPAAEIPAVIQPEIAAQTAGGESSVTDVKTESNIDEKQNSEQPEQPDTSVYLQNEANESKSETALEMPPEFLDPPKFLEMNDGNPTEPENIIPATDISSQIEPPKIESEMELAPDVKTEAWIENNIAENEIAENPAPEDMPDLIPVIENQPEILPADTAAFENPVAEESKKIQPEENTPESTSPVTFEKQDFSIPAAETISESAAESSDDKVEENSTNPIETGNAADDFVPTLINREKVLSEPEIIKPVAEIEQEENRSTQFDSVRIIESEPQIEVPAAQEKVENISGEKQSSTRQNITNNDTGSKKVKLKPLDEGTILNNRYEIVRKIGGGGMGAVYLAADNNLGGIMRAVKEMVQSHIEEAQQDKAISDFKRESMLLTSLDHPAIPTIYDYFFDENEGRFYLVMKYISGGDLASRLRTTPAGKMDEVNITDWAIQISDVLDYLHLRQPPIVYRDLKPSNIMIDGNSGRAMLIDFGIARWVNKEEKGVTAVGTMGYAPPELFSGNVETRSDIYSLGSTMFHLLTGADPQTNPLLIFDFEKHPRPRQINPSLSDQIERIIMRSVEYNTDNRFTSAAEMRDELKRHLENLKSGKVTFGVQHIPHSVPLSEQNVFCGFCGQPIVATDMFCAFCGSKQPMAQPGVQAENYKHAANAGNYAAPSNLTARLVVIGTNELQEPVFNLERDDNLVGRRDPVSNIFPEVDLSKFDPQTKISRRHARIWRDGGHFLLADMGSSNGTMVLPLSGDSVRLLPHQPHTLTNGEKVKIGDTTLHFIVG